MATSKIVSNPPPNGTDPFTQMVAAACEMAVKRVMNISDISPRRLLSVEETSTYLNLSMAEVYSMLSSKELVSVRHGKRVMVDIRDLEAWIEAHRAA
jgi:excisionase family DNA binding protein